MDGLCHQTAYGNNALSTEFHACVVLPVRSKSFEGPVSVFWGELFFDEVLIPSKWNLKGLCCAVVYFI